MDAIYPNRITGVIKARLKAIQMQLAESEQVDHSATKGVLRERYLSNFLKSILPPNYAVQNGFICDVLGGISPQLDLILSDISTIPSIVLSDEIALIPVETAISAIEVKSRLTTGDFEQLQSQNDSILALRPMSESMGPWKHGVRLFIFAYTTDVSPESLAAWFAPVPFLSGICTMNGLYIRRAPEGIVVQQGDTEDLVLTFVSTILHSIVKATQERPFYTLDTWRRYIVGVDPSLATT